MKISWMYKNDELRVQISINSMYGNHLEKAVAAFLSANKFEYYIEPDLGEIINDSRLFTLVPKSSNTNVASMETTPLMVLLATLMEEEGCAYHVLLTGTSKGIQLAAGISSKKSNPIDAKVVFGRQYNLIATDYIYWFNYSEQDHAFLLSLPYLTEGGCSLVTGFGDKHQVTQSDRDNDVVIGPILHDALSRKLCFTTDNWNSSTCIWGAPGYGKTTLCMNLVREAYLKHKINFIVIEPKTDYRNLQQLIPDLQVISLVHKYNPLLPPRGCNAYDYAEILLTLFRLASPTAYDNMLPDYLRKVYYKIIDDGNFSIQHFINMYNHMMRLEGYDSRAQNFIIAGKTRIDTFFRMFCGKEYWNKQLPGFDVSRILCTPTIIQTGQLTTPQMSSMYTYFIVSHIRMFMRKRLCHRITNCLLIEEAHSILSPEIDAGVRFELSNLLAEGRGHGLSVVICEQSPGRIDKNAANLCGNVLSFRVTSRDDQVYVSCQLGIAPELLNQMEPYTVWAYTNRMYQPERVRVRVDEQLLSCQNPLRKKF